MAAPESSSGKEKKDPFAETRMSLGEHLDELRVRLIKSVAAVLVAFVAAWIFREDLTRLATRPYHQGMEMLREHYVEKSEAILAEDSARERTEFFLTASPMDRRLRDFDTRLQWIKPGGGFVFVLKLCLYAALIGGAPILLWQMWQFIGAGLYNREKRAVRSYFPFSVLAFLSGILFGYLVIVPYGLFYLNRSVAMDVGLPKISVEYFLPFLSGLCVAFGVVFQLPLVMMFLGWAGLVQPAAMSKYRGHFVVVAFVLAAMLTPPDPFTQMMMGIPLVILYEVGIWCARFAIKRRSAPVPQRVA